jgi:hypothetical protein|tara:strand:+ start:438 stop:713 length:276 start_codon:yes stop_codon:yes gene_type:complete
MTNQFKNQVSSEVLSTIDALKLYAIEDITLLKSEGGMSICNTEHGTLHLTFENNLFSCYGAKSFNDITELLKNGTEIQMITLLMCSYTIEA